MEKAPYPLKRLHTGFFAARPTDIKIATQLLNGELHLGDYSFEIFDAASYDRLGNIPRAQLLVLHSLRWAEPLRRTADELTGAEDAWQRILSAWSRSESAADDTSAAWAPYVCEQRATAIALQPPTRPRYPYVADHLRILQRAHDLTASAVRRLDILRVRLALSFRSGTSYSDREALARQSVESTFSGNGYCVAGDLYEVAEAFSKWETELKAAGMSDALLLLEQLQSEEFWVHARMPDGSFVQYGNEVPDQANVLGSRELEYARTAGADGEPPRDVRFVDPEGLVSLRSGWGETEKDASEETHVSLILGPRRGKNTHNDLARITYSSQGVAWLIDPLGTEFSAANYHSIINVAEGIPKREACAQLTARYERPDVEGYVALIDSYYKVNWKRHAVFARTGNYLVVQDTLSARTTFEARLQWIVHADHLIERFEQGFTLSSGKSCVSLTFSGLDLDSSSVESVRDSKGRLVAQRIVMPFSVEASTPTRVTTAVTEVGSLADHSVEILAGDNEATVLAVRDKHLGEYLVVSPEYSAVMPLELTPRAAIASTNQTALDGELTDEEVLQLRTEVREIIRSTKRSIRAEGESVVARRNALTQLLEYAERRRLYGLRDHGLRSSMIDIAGVELSPILLSSGLLGNIRRSPIVQWQGGQMLHPQYSVPVLTSLSSAKLPEDLPESFIWSVDTGQLVPSCYVDQSPGDVLVVYFHGATDRTRMGMPRYERVRSFAKLGLGPRMFFSDPGLDLDSRMVLSWYVGTEDVELPPVMAQMILSYAKKQNIVKVLLVGNSGGGFAALQVAAHLEGVRALVIHPQISIGRYVPRLSQAAHWSSFGRDSVADAPELASRMDVVETYRRFDFNQHVHYIQNVGDTHHLDEHFSYFHEAFTLSENRGKLKVELPNFGPGHRLPPPERYLEYVRTAATEPGGEWTLRGLRKI